MDMCHHILLFTSDPELLFGAASEQRSLSDRHIPFVAQPGSALSGLVDLYPISLPGKEFKEKFLKSVFYNVYAFYVRHANFIKNQGGRE